MYKPSLVLMFASTAIAGADVLTDTQRFFGIGGQFPDYEEEAHASELDEASYSPADSDLGVQEVLAERPERSPIVYDANTSIFRTDNAPSGVALFDEPSWFFSSRHSLSWRPHLYEGWFGDFGLSQEFLRFDDSTAIDYENFMLRLGTYKTLPDLDDLVVFFRYEYQRLTTGSFSSSNYDAHRLRAGVQKVLWAAPRHQVVSSLSGAYEWSTDPAPLERNELSFDIAYRYSITDTLHTMATWRAAYYDFDDFGREDWTHGLGLELIWQLNPCLRAHASVYYHKNDSNTAFGINDYEAWTAGVGVGLRYTF